MLLIKQDPADPKRIAVQVSVRPDMPWYILQIERGGYFSNGTREKVDEWTEMVRQET